MRYAVLVDGTRVHRPSCQHVTNAERGAVKLLTLPQARYWLAQHPRRSACGACRPSFVVRVP